jgi:GAF domain-containing protein
MSGKDDIRLIYGFFDLFPVFTDEQLEVLAGVSQQFLVALQKLWNMIVD